ncbi:general odorant-binding protein 72 [Chironomus tepperi]|uniref:general odorant-binding protein 72 n=1 Tax=Chironomus tepperi TaxID=113505 RepID=UPI00391F2048
MQHITKLAFIICNIFIVCELFTSKALAAMTMAQFEQTLKTIRATCSTKNNLSDELIDGLKKGKFDESNKDLKSYVFCVAQMSGILSKRNEVNEQKMMSQIQNLLPDKMKEHSLAVWNECKTAQQGIPDKLDRIFKLTKCFYDVDPAQFVFP